MPRKLKYHEQKLLKKVDFLNWKADGNQREVKILRRYHIQDREDYHTYNKIVGMITSLTTHLKKMDPRDPVRIELTDLLLDKVSGSHRIEKESERAKRVSLGQRNAKRAF